MSRRESTKAKRGQEGNPFYEETPGLEGAGRVGDAVTDAVTDPFADAFGDAFGDAQEQERVRWEEQRKALQEKAQLNKATAEYQAELRRRQIEVEHEKQRERNQEMVLMQQQSARQIEAEKRQVAEQIEAERRATEKYKARFLAPPPSLSLLFFLHFPSLCPPRSVRCAGVV